MKRTILLFTVIVLSALLCCSLTACGGKEPNPTQTPSVAVSETVQPTQTVSVLPSVMPTAAPSNEPTVVPTAAPSNEPTVVPTAEPSNEPTVVPTAEPSNEPTVAPTAEPLPEPVLEGATVSYDGNAHYLEVKDLPHGFEVRYENNGKVDAGTYTVKAIVTSDGVVYAELTATLTIEKATYDMSAVVFDNAVVTYDKNEHYVRATNLPDGVTATYENNGKTEVGTYTVTALFTGDSKNYNRIDDQTAKLTINQRVLEVAFTGERSFRYDGNAHKTLSATVEGVLTGDSVTVEIAYSGDVIEEGEYVVTATMTAGSNQNYALSETSRTVTVTVTRETHRVLFLQEGQKPREILVKDLAAVQEIPDVIAVPGYRIRWEEFDLSCVTEDKTINAIVSKLYYIHYDANGGTLPEGNPTEVTEEEEFALQNPESEEYSFGGWRIEETGETILKIEKGTNTDLRLVAVWDRLQYYRDDSKKEYYVSGVIGTAPAGTIEIPDTHLTYPVVGIMNEADLSGIVSVSLGKNVRTLNGGLENASDLKYVFVAEENPYFHRNNNCLIETATDTLIAGGQFRTFPAEVKKIARAAFYKRAWLTEIAIPEGVTEIGESAFYQCENLQQATLPETLSTIGLDAFHSCSSLLQIAIPDSVTAIEDGAFSYCGALQAVAFGTGVETIGRDAFYACASLEEIRLPASLTSMGRNNPFAGCASLRVITVDAGNVHYTSRNNCLTEIATDTVIAGTTLAGTTQAEIPAGTLTIGNYAFEGCSRMTAITIPNSVTTVKASAFLRCNNLANIAITAGGKYSVSGNCIIETQTKTLVYGNAHSVIPDDGSVTIIGDNAFVETKITTLVLPAAVTTIRSGAFSFCSELTSVDFGGVTVIGQNAFQYCTSLTSVTVPEGVTKMEYYAFSYCDSLTEISLPASLTVVERSAWTACAQLRTISYGGTTAAWQEAVKKSMMKDEGTGAYEIVCTDGTLQKE